MAYPKITFKREAPRRSYEKSRWGAFHDGRYIGSVCSTYAGGWSTESASGYSTRYEAAYSMLLSLKRPKG